MTLQALLFTQTKARPGGIMQPFWDPVIATSIFHSSISNGWTPIPVIASTTSNEPYFFTMGEIAFISCTTPVEVSHWVVNTTLIPGVFLSAASMSDGFTALPFSTSIVMVSMPKHLHNSAQRSPNFPLMTTSTLFPLDSTFATHASIAPVPEDIRVKTSPVFV